MLTQKNGTALPALLAALAALAGLSACSSEGPTSPDPTTTGGTTTTGTGPGVGPTYYKDIAPILQKSCQTCHQPGDIAPFSLRRRPPRTTSS
jgi:hypothetical protein